MLIIPIGISLWITIFTTASIVLECISSLCDGQHREMQRYLHDQEQSLRVRMCLRA